MSPRPLASVVMLSYNRPAYLAEALASAGGQTFTDIEILVMDDCSECDTLAVIEELGDSRVIFHRQSHNVGAGPNVRDGFSRAKGKYVSTLHDDDRWDPRFLERLIPRLEENEGLSTAFSDHFLIDARGNVDLRGTETNTRLWGRAGLRPGYHRPFTDLALVRQAVPIHVASVLRRDVLDLDDFPDEVASWHDLWTGYLACRDGWGAYYLPERLAYYRVHAGSETATQRLRVARSSAFVNQRFLVDQRVAAHRRHFRARYASSRSTEAISLIRAGDTRAARTQCLQGLARRPTPRGMAALAVACLPRRAARAVALNLGGTSVAA